MSESKSLFSDVPIADKFPPKVIELMFCPVCGRSETDPFSLKERHFSGGSKCPGSPISVRYEVEAWWRT